VNCEFDRFNERLRKRRDSVENALSTFNCQIALVLIHTGKTELASHATRLVLKQAHCDPPETGPRKNLENLRKISRSHTPLPSAAPANGLWPAIFGLDCGFGRFFLFDRDTSCVID
jgi:hypothetical protein